MNEVSCRATAILLDAFALDGVAPEELAAATSLPLEGLRDVRQRIDWEDFVRLLDRAQSLVGLAGLEAAGERLRQLAWNRVLAVVGRAAWTEYQFLVTMMRFARPAMYRNLQADVGWTPDGRIRVELGLPEDRPGSLALMHVFLGMARSIPAMLGGSETSSVDSDLSPHRALYLLTPQRRLRPFERLRRSLKGRFFGDRVFESLIDEFREVEQQYAELERSRSELAARTRSLATLNAVADNLYRSLDFHGMAQRAVDTVAQQTRFPRVGIFVVKADRLELAAVSGSETEAPEDWNFSLAAGMAGQAIRDRRPFFAPDIRNAPFADPQVREKLLAVGLRSVVLVPLFHADDLVGMLGLASARPESLAEFDEQTFLALGKTVAAALTSAGYVARIEQEVSERQQVERALREEEERLRQLAENIDGVFYLWDAETGRTLYLSPSYARTSGRSLPDFDSASGGRNGLLDLVHPEDLDSLPAVFAREVPRERYELEYRIVQSSGGVRWLVDRAFPIHRADGSVSRIAGLAQDVTEVRELETQLRHSQKMDAVGLLAGGVAHDFNNLLTVISGYAELLVEGFEAGDARNATASEILRASERASALTRKLLALSRKQILDPAVHDLNQIVRELRALLASLTGEQVELRLELGAEPLPVRVDRGQFEQLLINLAANARDAMDGGGVLTISCAPVQLAAEGLDPELAEGVRLAVCDTGRGMDVETRARVFEPFFTTKGHDKGTGLGLSTVYGIVRQSGGDIRVRSSPGAGACFEIDLPRVGVHELAEAEAPSNAGAVSASSDATVLLVEDQVRVRQLASRVLRERGYRVVEAADGEEALEQLHKEGASFDLVVTDLVMPRMGGAVLAAKIRGELPELPFLFVSGHSDDGADDTPELPAGSKLLMKPFRPAALVRAVQESLVSPS